METPSATSSKERAGFKVADLRAAGTDERAAIHTGSGGCRLCGCGYYTKGDVNGICTCGHGYSKHR